MNVFLFFGCLLFGGEPVPVKSLVADLKSADGAKRIASTKELFRQGKGVLPDLKQAGAKQISPFGTIQTRRLDMVFSLIEGLKPSPRRAGYKSNSFGLHLENGITEDEVVQMGKKHGFVLEGELRNGVPNCYVRLVNGKSLAEVLRAVLTGEPKVTSVNLNYFET